MKTADVSGTPVMPYSQSLAPATGIPPVDKITLKKTGHLVTGNPKQDTPPASNLDEHEGKQPPALPQGKIMKPHVDTTGCADPMTMVIKKAGHYALGDRYPLDTPLQVKQAAAYFDEWAGEFDPKDRHEFAVNLVKRAKVLDVEVSHAARWHGSETYAPIESIKVALDSRKLVTDESLHEALTKMAGLVAHLPPDMFARVLFEFDKGAEINHLYDEQISDPWHSTFGYEKQANFSETIGNLHVTEMDLTYLAIKRLGLVKGTFTEEFAEEFRKDPVGIYKSLPVEQRRVLGNMAQDQRAGTPGS